MVSYGIFWWPRGSVQLNTREHFNQYKKNNMLKDIIPGAVQGSRYRFWWPRGSGKADKAL